jgi:alanine dehydrogenase
MKIGIPKEQRRAEKRVGASLETVKRPVKEGKERLMGRQLKICLSCS